ncbi:putative NRPS-like enzyme [Aspergillus saccharolyticus JOP 1030-1]|uniref:Putative NRPS-like enzyme n=1 Tax=Aspergillus saccharolyticus JOP 1030-1 TaxID=1450539 RepID=A0A318Z9G0_9EURO|nr:putative NRPS-like enzyme [Aspergillus saccharolyticus JOP 1030-1]PYH44041.1 putative NRPS-like enzyme [Aspergillus saccharolyticus JOP 1030-1]
MHPTVPTTRANGHGLSTSSIEDEPTSLPAILTAAAQSPTGICIYAPGQVAGSPARLSYADLARRAHEDACVLLNHIHDQPVVLIHLDNHADNIRWFWAVVYAGLLPAMSTPLSQNAPQRAQHLQDLQELLEAPVVLTSAGLLAQFPELTQPRTLTIEQLGHADPRRDATAERAPPQPRQGDAPAVLMLTSGSTGPAKAVSLTVPQMVAALRSKSRAEAYTHRSVLLNWIGLDHVANLLEIHLNAIFTATEQVQVQARDVLTDPWVLLRLIERHRVSHTFAPNFFLALLRQRIAGEEGRDPPPAIDLSSLQAIVTGGEANGVELAATLTRQLQRLGVVDPVLCIAYGLTEACAALTYGRFDALSEAKEGHEFASVGTPVDNARVRIQTATGVPASSLEIGEVQLSGPVVFRQYYRHPAATQRSFTSDGWFRTGDRGYWDAEGRLHLAGRDKEILVINGVNYSPQEIETVLELAHIPGLVPSHFAVFAHRPSGSDTEGYCVIYSPAHPVADPVSRDATAERVASIASTIPHVRPNWVIPVPATRLQKSSLGKLSRTKLQTEFLAGVFDANMIRSQGPIHSAGPARRIAPATPTEEAIVTVLEEMLEVPREVISVDQTIFALGVTSVTLFRFEQLLRERLGFAAGVSLITFLNSPVVRNIADTIDHATSTQYNPVVPLQPRGDRPPLWLVHPASGNVLAFLPLARTLTDRPLYGLTARGLGDHGQLFASIEAMADTYYTHVKRTQPHGPYALTGYSLGTTVAFELAKRLEANGDHVAFCAALDSPPHIIPLVQHLDWTRAAIRVTYFLGLIPQEAIPAYEAEMAHLSRDQVIARLLAVARPAERARLHLTAEQLTAIVYVTDNFGEMGRQYEPSGTVRKMDVFHCIPLQSVCADRGRWVEEYLSKWQDFSREEIGWIECEGDHADMLNPQYVEGFEQRLSRVLRERGL